MSIIRYFKLWNMWRRSFGGHWTHKLLVLTGLKRNLNFEMMKTLDRFRKSLVKLYTESR